MKLAIIGYDSYIDRLKNNFKTFLLNFKFVLGNGSFSKQSMFRLNNFIDNN